jgi:hypothetical protein
MEILTNQRTATHAGTQAGKLKPTDYKGKIQNKISQTNPNHSEKPKTKQVHRWVSNLNEIDKTHNPLQRGCGV